MSDSMLTGARATDVPFQLTPIILIGGAGPGVDVLERLRACYAAMLPTWRGLGAGLTEDDAERSLVDVPRPEDLAAGVPDAVATTLRGSALQLQRTVRHFLCPPLGTVQSIYVSCLDREQAGFPNGTVVLVRQSDKVTEQYVFPRIRVDLSTGERSVVNLSRPSAPPRVQQLSVAPMEDPAKTVTSLLLSVSPFLPPPWGAIATGLLSLFNLLIDVADAPTGPSPYQQVVSQITDFIAADDLKNLGQAPLTNVTTQMQNWLASLTTPVDEMTSLSVDVISLWAYIDGQNLDDRYFLGIGVQTVDSANAFLWETLQKCDDTNYTPTLALLIRGVALQLLLYKMSVQLRAVSAQVHQKANDMTSFDRDTRLWTSQLADIAVAVGADPKTGVAAVKDPANYTDDNIAAGLSSTSWIPRVTAWMAQIRRDRLALIDKETSRYSEYKPGAPTPDGGTTLQWQEVGWTWRDPRLSPDGGAPANVAYDTQGSGCCAGMDQHRDAADQALAAHKQQVATDLDNALAPHLASARSWGTFIAGFHELLPASPPSQALTGVGLATGEPTPKGPAWVSGNVVRYQVALVNEKGPSPAGPWSNELTVGATAGATVSGFTADAGTDALWLYRQVRAAGQSWDKAEEATLITILQPDTATKAFPTTYTDKDPGS